MPARHCGIEYYFAGQSIVVIDTFSLPFDDIFYRVIGMHADNVLSNLCRVWIHAHEESDGNRLVFHPQGYPFPPARGRRAIVLESDGTVRAGIPAPDDRSASVTGRWSYDGRQLTIEGPVFAGVYDVETADEQSLILKSSE